MPQGRQSSKPTEGGTIFGFEQLPLDGEASVAAYSAKEASVATNGSESQIINHPTSILYKNAPKHPLQSLNVADLNASKESRVMNL